MADQPPYLAYCESVIRLDRRATEAVVEGYLARPRDVAALYTEVFAPALIHAGREWERNRISVVHEHYLSAVTIDLIHRYGPTTWAAPPADAPVAVACCAPGERHSIGLMMVVDLLRAAGLVVHDLGADPPAEAVRGFVAEAGADLLCVSVALDRRLSAAAALIAAVRRARPETVIAVGGAALGGRGEPIRRRLGADFAAEDAGAVRQLVPAWVTGRGRRSTPMPPQGPSAPEPAPCESYGGERPVRPDALESPLLRVHGDDVARYCFDHCYATWPGLDERYRARGRHYTAEDNYWHLEHLDAAVASGEEGAFADYADWLVGLLSARGMERAHVAGAFGFLAEALERVGCPPAEEGHRQELIRLLRANQDRISGAPPAAEGRGVDRSAGPDGA
ncbi:MAG: B12-binding domain-containing protein [Planctomycetaceae bacterium]